MPVSEETPRSNPYQYRNADIENHEIESPQENINTRSLIQLLSESRDHHLGSSSTIPDLAEFGERVEAALDEAIKQAEEIKVR